MPPLTLSLALERADWQAAGLLLLLGLVQALESLPAAEVDDLLRALEESDADQP